MSATPSERLANPEQLIADLRRQLAECKAERDEALEQQTATAEVLQVINSSPGDLAPVFDAILEKAMRLCEAAFGGLWLFGERYVATALRGVPQAYADFLKASTQFPGPGTAAYRFLHGERSVIHNLDLATEEAYLTGQPLRVALVDLGGARTAVQVPLLKEGEALGLMTIYRQEVRPFSDKQIALLQNFAAQAVIAMENARLITETREALEQQRAAAEILQVINSSPGDLAPVFQTMIEKGARVCDASQGILGIYEGDGFRGVATFGFPQSAADGLSLVRTPPPGTTLARAQQLKHTVQIADISLEPGFAPVFAANPALRDARTNLVVPMLREGELVGAILVYREVVRAFSDRQIALLENFAAQAVIAMENARLLGDLQQRTAELIARDADNRALIARQLASIEVLQAISASGDDPQPVLDLIVRHARELCNAHAANIVEYDGALLHQRAWDGGDPVAVARLRAAFPRPPGRETIPGRVVLSRQAVHVADVRADPEIFAPGRDTGARSFFSVPLLREGRVIGVLGLTRFEAGEFDEFAITLVQSFAEQAVIALENARLLGELRQRTEEVAELNRVLEARVAEQVEELGRVGRLKRFLAPQLAELIVSQGDEKILESHRREIVVVFCDVRGYTAFTETAEPEEVLDFLREYHGALGPLVSQFEGTLDQFSGDGIMVFFNDPVPIPDPAERAVKMAVAMREAAGALIAAWRERGRELGFGAGIAQGYATLGQIGFSERSGYTAIGTVCNVAARLCAAAKDNQILLSQRVNAALKGSVATERLGPLTLKGLTQPVVAYNVALGASQPPLRLIEDGPQTV